jgi:hypothetical protein
MLPNPLSMYCPCAFFDTPHCAPLFCPAYNPPSTVNINHNFNIFNMKSLQVIPWLCCCFLAAAMPLTGQNVGIGTTEPTKKLDVQGAGGLKVNSTNNGTGTVDWISGNFGGTAGNRVVMGLLNGQAAVGAHSNALDVWAKLHLAPAGGLNIGSLSGTGTRMVVVNANGDLSALAIPTGNPGTVTNVSAAATSGNPISILNNTTTPLIDIPAANATRNGYLSSADWTTFNNKFSLPALTSGSLLFSDGSAITQNNAKLFWDNTNGRLGVGLATPGSTLEVSGAAGLRVSSTNSGSGTTDWIAGNFGGTTGNRVVMGLLEGKATIGAHNSSLSAWEKLYLAPTGGLNIGSLSGTGNRMVVADANGDLITQVIPTGGGGTVTNVSAAATPGNPLTVVNGASAPVIDMAAASATTNGYLSAADWTTFNNKQPALANANATTSGILTNTDWTTFNNKFNLPALTSGSVLFSNGITIGQNHGKFFWDNTQNRLGVGLTTPASTLDVAGTAGLKVSSTNPGSGTADWIAGNFGAAAGSRVVMGNFNEIATIGGHNADLTGWTKLMLNPGGVTAVGSLVGTGNRMVVANAAGELSAQPMPVSDNLGNHVASQTVNLNNNWLSNDGTAKGIRIDNTGQVGIGIATPQGALDVANTASGTPVSGGFTVKNDGKVGIGTNAPTANLDVNGSLRFRNGAAAGAVLTGDANGNASWTNLSNLTVAGGIGVSTPVDGSWIAINAGNNATGTGSNTDRFVAGNVNNAVTIGGHNKDLNAWTDLVINEGGSATVTVGSSANATPTVGNNASGLPRKLIVNGDVRQGYYGVSTGAIPGNSFITITWNHGLGYNPVVMCSLDQTNGGAYMDFCSVSTTSVTPNRVDFIIRNLGSNTALGSLRWILVW